MAGQAGKPKGWDHASGTSKTFEGWVKDMAKEGYVIESRGHDGQRDTTADKDRTNDQPQSGLIREKIAKLSKQAQRDGAHTDMMQEKIKALAERFNGSRERGRDEERGR